MFECFLFKTKQEYISELGIFFIIEYLLLVVSSEDLAVSACTCVCVCVCVCERELGLKERAREEGREGEGEEEEEREEGYLKYMSITRYSVE